MNNKILLLLSILSLVVFTESNRRFHRATRRRRWRGSWHKTLRIAKTIGRWALKGLKFWDQENMDVAVDYLKNLQSQDPDMFDQTMAEIAKDIQASSDKADAEEKIKQLNNMLAPQFDDDLLE